MARRKENPNEISLFDSVPEAPKRQSGGKGGAIQALHGSTPQGQAGYNEKRRADAIAAFGATPVRNAKTGEIHGAYYQKGEGSGGRGKHYTDRGAGNAEISAIAAYYTKDHPELAKSIGK